MAHFRKKAWKGGMSEKNNETATFIEKMGMGVVLRVTLN